MIAVYNGERYLEESVSSILGQSFRDFELIVVDDGSTDGTADLLARMSQQDSRVVVIRQENQGQTASLNRAIGLARGKYLARQDADDVSLPERFDRQVRYLDEHASVGAVGTATEVIDQDGRVIGVLPTHCGIGQVRKALSKVRSTLIHGSVMMRRHAFEAVGGYRTAFRAAQDFDLWLRMAQRFDLDNLPERFYRWRMNPNGVYATRRTMQLKYCGIALTFAREREVYGDDSYQLLELGDREIDAFAARYRMRGPLYSIWGELLFRGRQNPAVARVYLRRALFSGFIRAKTLCLFGWSLLGLAWPGTRPLPPASHR